jgi:hypothetical protein
MDDIPLYTSRAGAYVLEVKAGPITERKLIQVANLLAKGVRHSDVVARIGGDEFGILLESSDESDAQETAVRLIDQISACEVTHDGEALPLSVAIGVGMIDALDTPMGDGFFHAMTVGIANDVARWGRRLGRDITGELEPMNLLFAQLGSSVTAQQYVAALDDAQAWSRRVAAWWEDHDVLVLPVSPEPPVRLGEIGPDNPDPDAGRMADSVETTLDAFERVGIERIFWLTMIGHYPYLKMNDELRAAAEKHPKLTVVDWYGHSKNHPEWFQDDGLHLGGIGAQAMARLIRRKLVDAGVAVPPVLVKTHTLPVARHGKPYSARLQAVSGRRPYGWSFAGRLPLGLHLRPSGVLWGVARARPGLFTLTVRAKDAIGQIDTRKLVLRLR